MRLVNPVGREQIEAIANFDIILFGGCACSINYDNGTSDNASAKIRAPQGGCACNCSYSNENQIANRQVGID